jgi:copper(I)-binding protein
MKTLSTLIGALVISSTAWAADVEVNAPYARAVPPGQPNSAAFMELSNHGNDDIALIGARSSAADVVELHTHIHDQGVMRMRRIEQIELPAQETVTLQPGGLHIMLIGLQQTLSEGENVDMTLEFSDGSEQAISLPVKPVVPMNANMKMKMKSQP